jgi:hypothetical protein
MNVSYFVSIFILDLKKYFVKSYVEKKAAAAGNEANTWDFKPEYFEIFAEFSIKFIFVPLIVACILVFIVSNGNKIKSTPIPAIPPHIIDSIIY